MKPQALQDKRQYYLKLAANAIRNLLGKGEIAQEDVAVNAEILATEYAMAENIGAERIPLDDIDFIAPFSGRSRLLEIYPGTEISVPGQPVRTPDTFDPFDTLRRTAYAVDIAKQCTLKNWSKGIEKPVYIYFDGIAQQNKELKNILERDGSFLGFPSEFFIIDPIPLDSTMGQVIGFSEYLHRNWSAFSERYHLSRYPNILICSSTYHTLRIKLAIGSNSPLHTPFFWQSRPDLFNKLPLAMRNYVLNPGSILKNASIVVLGCDRDMSVTSSWEKDLSCDMEAVVNYSSLHRPQYRVSLPPSVASVNAPNILPFFKNEEAASLIQSRRFRLFDGRDIVSIRAKQSIMDDEEIESTHIQPTIKTG